MENARSSLPKLPDRHGSATAAKIEKLLNDSRQNELAATKFKRPICSDIRRRYRAALDNETIAKHDTRLAIILTTLASPCYCFLLFPSAHRPFGSAAFDGGRKLPLCLFVLFLKSMSMLAVVFGGAIMGFTVDLGITYLLFSGIKKKETYGRQARGRSGWPSFWRCSRRSALFFCCWISDFKFSRRFGVFSALGVTFAFLFVLIVFPKIFPSMPPANSQSNPLLINALKKIAAPAKWKLLAHGCFRTVMLFSRIRYLMPI